MWERIKKLSDNAKHVMYLLGLIATICGSIYFTIDITLDAKFTQLNLDVERRLSITEQYMCSQIEKNILKQYDKIMSEDYDDIKLVDLEDCMKDWVLLENPSQNAITAFEVVRNYYLTHDIY